MEYGEDSIRQLKGADRVRKRPGVVFGSDTIVGAMHAVKEIVNNATDESRAGYGKVIKLDYYGDGKFTLTDDGRGVPMGWNTVENRWNWELVFCELYAGGKYNPESGDYEDSVGMNGLGATAVQYASEFFKVRSYREDGIYSMEFTRGEPDFAEVQTEPNTTGKTGTMIHWKLDPEIFVETNIPFSTVYSYCESQAHVSSLTFILVNHVTGEEFTIEGAGLAAYLEQLLGSTEIIERGTARKQKSGVERGKGYTASCEVHLCITEDEDYGVTRMYHNTADITAGQHLLAFNSAVFGFFKTIAKRQGVALTEVDILPRVSAIISTFSSPTSYANQTKDGVSNHFIWEIVHATVESILSELWAKRRLDAFVDSILMAAQIRADARELAKQKSKLRAATRSREPSAGFVDCRSNSASDRELYIVEGDSALGACKLSRDGNTQAILPIRGKTLNCFKAGMDKILKNTAVMNVIAEVGTGVDTRDEDNLFDFSKLRYNKIIIASDADVDGSQIRVLLFTLFYRLAPRLLEENKIFVVETPLYELVTANGSYFAYNQAERDVLMEDLKQRGIRIQEINRSKGLGENDPGMMWHTTMNPETRRLVPLKIDTTNPMVHQVTSTLFGLDPFNGRKGFVRDAIAARLKTRELVQVS